VNIIFLVSSLGPGGAERVATTLCNAWAKRGDAVTLVTTFSGASDQFYTLHNNVELFHLSGLLSGQRRRDKNYINRLQALRQLVRRINPQVVVSFLPNVNIAALTATAFSGIPCIVCERSDPAEQPIGWMWRLACGLFYRYADLVCVQTQAVAVSIHQVYGGLKKVVVVPNPLPEDLLLCQPKERNNGRKILLSMGRLSDEKQVNLIINSFAKLAPHHPDWDLHLYGRGPQCSALQTQIEQLDLQDRAYLRGATTAPWRVMAEADAFVMASLYEGFPNSMMEAMGMGLPCVSTDCPSGPREISRDGKDALLVSPEYPAGLSDALGRLMSDASLRKDLGLQARKSVIERYALPVVLKQWDDLFYSLGVHV
jgi:GalNAc-alpha-(1->4)-GalNAc-alpha-(1->3)-diNAcBac-PP-undecaprenol alpha-1,4-N-acetyl-D-galactosaminyltransferase